MSTRRLLAWVAVYVSLGLAVLGFLLFVLGIAAELLINRQALNPNELSPVIQLALAGLCLSAVMVTSGFVLVGILLARQTRRQAPGYGEAYVLMQQLQFQQALPLLERAVRMGRETPDLLMLLASAYAHTGQLAKAQSTADRAVSLFPQNPSAYIALANGYRVQASYEEAARVLQTALQLAPEQPVIWAELAFLHVMNGEKNAAFEALKTAAQGDLPAMYQVRVYYHLARAYKVAGDIAQSSLAMTEFMKASVGIEAWRSVVSALEGTAYGQALRYEIAAIEDAIAKENAVNKSSDEQ
jgi:Flp pilus assembly protein TadD